MISKIPNPSDQHWCLWIGHLLVIGPWSFSDSRSLQHPDNCKHRQQTKPHDPLGGVVAVEVHCSLTSSYPPGAFEPLDPLARTLQFPSPRRDPCRSRCSSTPG